MSGWFDRANCLGHTDVMFPVSGETLVEQSWREDRARWFCERCPVLDECRAWVLGTSPDLCGEGFTAGMTAAERGTWRRKQRAKVAPAPEPWDTNAEWAGQLNLLDQLLHGELTP